MMNGNGHRAGIPIFYRELPQTDEDWKRLRTFLVDVKGFIPPTHLGVAAVAERDDGKIVGALVLQMVPYLGPFKIDEDYQGYVKPENLKAVVDGTFRAKGESALIVRGYLALTDNESVARIAEKAGMRRLDCITLVETLDKERPIPTL